MDIAFEVIRTLIVAFIAAYFASILSLQRYYAEKLFDRKMESYISITNALYDMKAYCEDAILIRDSLGPENMGELQNKELKKNILRQQMKSKELQISGHLLFRKALWMN